MLILERHSMLHFRRTVNWKRHWEEDLGIPPALDDFCKDHEVEYLAIWHENRHGFPSP